jgi:hypothetical protein
VATPTQIQEPIAKKHPEFKAERGQIFCLLILFVILLATRAWLSLMLWTVAPASKSPDIQTFRNQIIQPTLNVNNWSIEHYGGGYVYLQRQYNDLVAHVSGTGISQARIYQYANLTNGKTYAIAFSARAEQARILKVRVAADNNGGPTTVSHVAAIDDKWRSFRYVFVATNTPTNHTRFPEFCFDNVNGNVWLSNIRATELD